MSLIVNNDNHDSFLSEISVRLIDVEATQSLRHSVLWPEMDISYVLLPEDDRGSHVGAFLPSSDKPIAVISLFVQPIPSEEKSVAMDHHIANSEPAARFRKFACHPDYQRRGIGTKLLKHVFTLAASELGVKVIWCDARLTTSEWYRKRGMVPFGSRFFKGSVEYTRMKASL
ncbi:acyl-CoA N-acyltransferase [Hygrophoropsis aurantiaca]|uniref:Acyl-CoA N-acyltransferase n=1 Tax=Hygrophoropsis aurantiaca TaxID=72124 RepID=A0ACB8AIU9_9AGAM|nr:acyl-CoA N-acyltransferase [Hygrophoropsis aurantiaca]